jgi:hypothetical protein
MLPEGAGRFGGQGELAGFQWIRVIGQRIEPAAGGSSMKFIQVIEYTTSRFDEVDAMVDRWVEQTQGRRTPSSGYTGRDRDDPNRYVDVVVFPSYEEAMRNNDLPETRALAEQWGKLCDGEPTFRNLDVVRDDDYS